MARKHSAQGQLRKRHWFLGTVVILCGSWITHTTTATIESLPIENAIASPQHLSAQDSSETDLTLSLDSTSRAKGDVTDKPLQLQTALLNVNASAPLKTVAVAAPTKLVSRPYTIRKGESLGIIFRKKGLDLAIPHSISQHETAKQLTSIRVGREIDFRFSDAQQLKEIRYSVSPLKELIVELDGNQVANAHIAELSYQTVQHTVSAEISSSLFEAAQKAGLSNNLIMEMVRIFGWDVDFVQDIRGGDNFHIVYTDFQKGGKKLTDGNILAAEFTTQGHTYRAIRYHDKDGTASYYTPEGESMLGTFLRSPVEFSRISSRFGKRKHPISKKWKTHKGVDYAASRGTPIRATADGKVTLASRKGGYGKTVEIRHAGRFSTLYAHMNGYAKGIRSGARVKQGQTIGYVGSTGMSTGPHLHYEFRVDGVHRNSLTYKTPKASSVEQEHRHEFDQKAIALGLELDQAKHRYELAKSAPSADTQSAL